MSIIGGDSFSELSVKFVSKLRAHIRSDSRIWPTDLELLLSRGNSSRVKTYAGRRCFPHFRGYMMRLEDFLTSAIDTFLELYQYLTPSAPWKESLISDHAEWPFPKLFVVVNLPRALYYLPLGDPTFIPRMGPLCLTFLSLTRHHTTSGKGPINPLSVFNFE